MNFIKFNHFFNFIFIQRINFLYDVLYFFYIKNLFINQNIN